jgi:hypothetical protein
VVKMATEFKILRGKKSTLIDENGVALIPEEKLVNGYWYLTNDTAEVYVALEIDGRLQLKKINECDVNNDFPSMDSFEARLDSLEADHTHAYGYRKDFPAVGEVNHLYIAADTKRTYVYTNNAYLPIADQFDYTDHDANVETPAVRIIFGGNAEQ